ncbi:unnamed protein product [Lathyrus oleraceus]|uniref:F-box domain-containing protein n=1 Tax=Pisum sativum TaxID=3888 RepID=A0A9D5AZP1_PEA|nr:F-box/kelch-repeat protein At3g23880-like [Pisum sativum]KAI5430162.1 hypothetical protein KIW84_034659 [Pisum sativum]
MSLLPPSHSLPTPNAPPLPVFLPSELIAEVLSWFTVKPLMRLMCVSKSWKSLISDPTFVKLHLHRSSQNADFTFAYTDGLYNSGCRSVSFTLIRPFENSPIIINLPKDPYHQLNDKDIRYVVGSCNGLLCLLGSSRVNAKTEKWFRFWNPATRTMSPRLGSSCDNDPGIPFDYTFGCDKSNNTYKVVAIMRKTVRIFSLQDNVWRNIQDPPEHSYCLMKAVYLRGSVNWLIIQNHYRPTQKYTTTNKPFAIISLDLGTETHTQLSPPQGVQKIPIDVPNLSIVNDCLCFSHDFEKTHLIIWLMKEFGMEDSWIQFLKISYHDLQLEHPRADLFPLCHLEKNDTLVLTNQSKRGIFIYNRRDNRLMKISNPLWYTCANYVESLVSYC